MRPLIITLVASLCCVASVVHAQDVNGGFERQAARRAAIAQARGQVQAAQFKLKAAEQRVKANYAANPEMTNAQAALDQAQAELDRQSGPVFERLRQNNPEYRAALEEEDAAARRLAEEHQRLVAENPAATQPATQRTDIPEDGVSAQQQEQSLNVPVPSDAQVTAAVDKLNERSRRLDLEAQALAADPTTSQLRQKLEQATADLKALKAQYDAALLNDPEYRAARDELANAKAQLAQAAGGNY